nr:hypothetical protein BaRGS_007797 [Batillaria attramentaria]
MGGQHKMEEKRPLRGRGTAAWVATGLRAGPLDEWTTVKKEATSEGRPGARGIPEVNRAAGQHPEKDCTARQRQETGDSVGHDKTRLAMQMDIARIGDGLGHATGVPLDTGHATGVPLDTGHATGVPLDTGHAIGVQLVLLADW